MRSSGWTVRPRATRGDAGLSALPWLSIDNDDSRDLDQLSVAEPLEAERVRVRVAVADVDLLVHPGDAIDQHASTNTTSVYTVAQIFPMLPTRLSTDLTSLGQDQTRAALIIDMTIDGAGALLDSDVYRASVLNHAKLAYGEVADWLAGSAPAPAAVATSNALQAQLRLQQQVAARLHDVRYRQRRADLASVESARGIRGGQAARCAAWRRMRRGAHRDLVIAAVGVTVTLPVCARGALAAAGAANAAALGWLGYSPAAPADALPPDPSAAALECFLRHAQVPADPGVRRMCRWRSSGYSAGANTSWSCPERGIRALRARGAGLYACDRAEPALPGSDHAAPAEGRLERAARALAPAALAALAAHCTVQEDNAAKVERRVRKSAAALLSE